MEELEKELVAGLPDLILGIVLIAVALAVRAILPRVLDKHAGNRRAILWIEGAVPPLMYLLIACSICTVALALVTMLPESDSYSVNKILRELPDSIGKIIRIAVIVFIGWAVIGANKRSNFFLVDKAGDSEESRLALIRFSSGVLNIVIAAFMAVMIITELGYNVTALVTGLGLGGLTVALAAKDAAANFFGGAVIVMDRPFEIGDWIKTDLVEGTVTDINMRATTIRTSAGAHTIIPNQTLSNSAITNWSRGVERRRIEADLGFEYGAAPEDIKAFTLAAKAMLEADEDVDAGAGADADAPDVVVRFFELGEYSLSVKLYCYTKCTAYADFLAVKERILYKLIELAAQHHLAFAFPTQTLEMKE
ncbi:MAG: mechanosensitive ion channel family protein [Clostridiales Family XIII bacterium]|jgi:MscS family membrane protein|nr:mechanosensitive ion channel family protein [Clostridiales Family XIII bacterium]